MAATMAQVDFTSSVCFCVMLFVFNNYRTKSVIIKPAIKIYNSETAYKECKAIINKDEVVINI
jgi:hypothetical protein